jgi:hypothetical protein
LAFPSRAHLPTLDSVYGTSESKARIVDLVISPLAKRDYGRQSTRATRRTKTVSHKYLI